MKNLPEQVYLRAQTVGIRHAPRVLLHAAVSAVQPPLQRGEIIRRGGRHEAAHHLLLLNHAAPRVRGGRILLQLGEGGDGVLHGERGVHDLQRILAQALPLHAPDVVVRPGGQGQDQRDARDADGRREGGQRGPPLLGPQVCQGQAQALNQTPNPVPI